MKKEEAKAKKAEDAKRAKEEKERIAKEKADAKKAAADDKKRQKEEAKRSKEEAKAAAAAEKKRLKEEKEQAKLDAKKAKEDEKARILREKEEEKQAKIDEEERIKREQEEAERLAREAEEAAKVPPIEYADGEMQTQGVEAVNESMQTEKEEPKPPIPQKTQITMTSPPTPKPVAEQEVQVADLYNNGARKWDSACDPIDFTAQKMMFGRDSRSRSRDERNASPTPVRTRDWAKSRLYKMLRERQAKRAEPENPKRIEMIYLNPREIDIFDDEGSHYWAHLLRHRVENAKLSEEPILRETDEMDLR